METEKLSLKEEITSALEEARTVLPGIQALFGFQMIAVFNDGFKELPHGSQMAHVVAFGLVVIAIALLMAPAAYHRIVEPTMVSRSTVTIISKLIRLGMWPLAFAIALETYTVLMAALKDQTVAVLSAGLVLTILIALWFIWPSAVRRLKHG